MINPTIRSAGAAFTKCRKATVEMTGPVAHLDAIESAWRLKSTFWMAAEVEAYLEQKGHHSSIDTT